MLSRIARLLPGRPRIPASKKLSDADLEALRKYVLEVVSHFSQEISQAVLGRIEKVLQTSNALHDTQRHCAQEMTTALTTILQQILISNNHIVTNNHSQLRALIDLLHCHSRQQSLEHMERYMLNNERYAKSKRITHHGKRYFSMGTEDGIIAEIFNRIGTTDRRFVEIGCNPDGLQNNTLYLLLNQWRGLWVEMDAAIRHSAETKFKSHTDSGQLIIRNEKITWDNVNQVIEKAGFQGEVDFFSLDIDSWEYFVWEALEVISPRVAVIEYQSLFGPEVACSVPKDLNYQFIGSYYAGCSLKALEKLGRKKGYSLVGCDFSGTNAFFVRSDIVGEYFESVYHRKSLRTKPNFPLPERRLGP